MKVPREVLTLEITNHWRPREYWLPSPVAVTPKVGRNERCLCGSGKKYKHCCGRLGTRELGEIFRPGGSDGKL